MEASLLPFPGGQGQSCPDPLFPPPCLGTSAQQRKEGEGRQRNLGRGGKLQEPLVPPVQAQQLKQIEGEEWGGELAALERGVWLP